MKFGKKKQGKHDSDQENKNLIRQKIWEDPAIIEELFKDEDWHSFDGANRNEVPSKRIEQRVDEEIKKEQGRVRRLDFLSYRTNRIIQVGIAAALLLFIAFNIWQWKEPADEQPSLASIATDSLSSVRENWISVANNSNVIDTVVLPDGTTVRLFAFSSMRYLSDFSAEARDIYLDGKAYFSVKKDSARPFSVYAGGTKTTALGTSFTINTRAEKQHTSVELHTGKVRVASTADIPLFESVFLDRQGENLLFNADMRIVKHNKAVESKPFVAQREKPTTNGSALLRLENIPLPDVFRALQDAYHVSIRVKDSEIAKILYTGIIDPGREQLTDVLTVICLINDLRYVAEQDGSFSIYQQQEPNEKDNL
ncbi:FecR family protein [Sphingobacterium sp. LRF_L2]|uniref:FecR family protein n=1 Tax=Sphingobacterium sp. LRF_L2 TaxID=3369421 RepID=UPI003F615610